MGSSCDARRAPHAPGLAPRSSAHHSARARTDSPQPLAPSHQQFLNRVEILLEAWFPEFWFSASKIVAEPLSIRCQNSG
jgi:hypothetical protein